MKAFILLTFISCFFKVEAQNSSKSFSYYGNNITINLQKDAKGTIQSTVLNTDSGSARVFTVEQNQSQSAFIAQIQNEIITVCPKLTFTIDKVVLKLDKTYSLKYDDLINALSDENYITLLKPHLFFESGSFNSSLAAIDARGKNLFKTGNTFTLRKVEQALHLYKENNEKGTVTDENGLYKLLKGLNDETINKNYILTEDKFKELRTNPIAINPKDVTALEEMYLSISGKDEFQPLASGMLTVGTDIFTIKIKTEEKQGVFSLRICKLSNGSCVVSPQMSLKTDWTKFSTVVTTILRSEPFVVAQSISEYELHTVYDECARKNNQSVIDTAMKPFKDTIHSLSKQIEDLQPKYAGILKVKDKARVWKNVNGHYEPVEGSEFTIEYATVHFFNNKGKNILITGIYNEKRFNIDNYYYSIRLASFNESNDFIPISRNDKDALGYYLNYNDVFDLEAADNVMGSAVRNRDYRIEPGKPVKLEERKLADYFTAVIFSDFLGLNNQNANALLQAEGRVRIPLWISNLSAFSIFTALNADVNVSVYNGFDDRTRYITPINTDDGTAAAELTSLTINNFDYIKNNNVNAGIGMDLLNVELKRLSTDWSFGYGLRYYRAGLKYIIEQTGGDVTKSYQMNALTHEVYTNFEIRPQLNFGADFLFGVNWINARGSVKDIPVEYSINNNLSDKTVLRMQLNLYSKVNPDQSNDGIYARLGGFYHLGLKDFYPQIMIGYATNLSSFVNKFKKG